MKNTFIILFLVFSILSAGLVFAAGEAESGASASGQKVEGEPYVDHVHATVAAYESATGNKITSFNEAPMLTALVNSGDLPPVEDRLPKDVQVLRPRDEIGIYGGTFLGGGSSEELGETVESSSNSLGTYPANTRVIYPNTAKAWSMSADNQVLTINLREGMKWSDGAPITSADFEFWVKDILLNPEITPKVHKRYKPGGEVFKLEVVDDYTVRLKFAVPYYAVFETWSMQRPLTPKHYLKEWHADYNSQASAKAKEEGFDSWWQAFGDHYVNNRTYRSTDVNRPGLDPWLVKEHGVGAVLFERNPYYWKIDTVGNQLPYMDRAQVTAFPQPNQSIPLKAMSGEIDVQVHHLAMADFPVYKQNEAQGNYSAHLFPFQSKGFAAGIALNYTHKDPVYKEMFWDIRFRQALSLAIDRDDISNTFFFGKVGHHIPPVPPTWTGFEDWMRTYYSEHDVAKANQLLDEMGLKWDAQKKWRLRPDGKQIQIEGIWVAEWFSYFDDLTQMISKHWEDIGIQMTPKFVVEEAAAAIAIANDQDMIIGGNATSTEFRARGAEPVTLRPAWHWYSCCALSSAPWRLWFDTDGAEGQEPPAIMKELFDISTEWTVTSRDDPRYGELAHEMIKINTENLFFFGTVNIPPRVVIVNNRIGNMQGEGGFLQTLPLLRPYNLDTLYIKQ